MAANRGWRWPIPDSPSHKSQVLPAMAFSHGSPTSLHPGPADYPTINSLARRLSDTSLSTGWPRSHRASWWSISPEAMLAE
jgi:hypothetical protein